MKQLKVEDIVYDECLPGSGLIPCVDNHVGRAAVLPLSKADREISSDSYMMPASRKGTLRE